MIKELAGSQADDIMRAEIVKGTRSESPVSVRLSAPLLEALDRLAHAQHRKRGNLIQHILLEYVQANEKPTH
jgi:metal-responsive CopG/Arc/MetJ family transcriptional regulator